jgi:hypothetical protein
MHIVTHRETGRWKRCFANNSGPRTNSELALLLAPGAKQFRSGAGIDKTFDTVGSQDAPIVENGP